MSWFSELNVQTIQPPVEVILCVIIVDIQYINLSAIVLSL